MLMLMVRCGGIRKNGKRGLAVFRNLRRTLDFGAMLRTADFPEFWRRRDAHNSFLPRFAGSVPARAQFGAKRPGPKFGVKLLCIIRFFRQRLEIGDLGLFLGAHSSFIIHPSSFPVRLLVNTTPVSPIPSSFARFFA